MRRNRHKVAKGLAAVMAATLCGCSLSLPQLPRLPQLPALPTLTQSADEARAELAASLVPQVTTGLKRPGTLTVGLRAEATHPFVSEREGQVRGLDVEVAGALANELGLPVSCVVVDDVVDALTTTCDCVMEVRADEAAGFEVGCAYASSAVGIFSATGEQVADAQVLAGRTLAVQAGSAAQAALRRSGIAYTELEVESIDAGIDALTSGQADFALGSVAAFSYVARLTDAVSLAGTLDTPVDVGIAFPGGDDVVSAAIRAGFERISGNGVLAECRRRWVASLEVLAPEVALKGVVTASEDEDYAEEVIVEERGGGTEAGSNAVTLY